MLSTVSPESASRQLYPSVEGGLASEKPPIIPEVLRPGLDEVVRHLGDASVLVAAEGKELAGDDLRILSTLGNLYKLFNGEYIKASGDHSYGHLFGRDSEYVIGSLTQALDAAESDGRNHNLLEMRCRPIIEQGICSLVAHIGTKEEKIGQGLWRPSGEAPGKILHEAGKVTGPLELLAPDWQDSDEDNRDYMVYYGSVDSTPLFIKTVKKYDQNLRRRLSPETADDFLQREVDHYRGETLTVGEGVLGAVNWVVHELHASDLGFVESRRMPGQEKGLPNQVLKDSLTSYVHASGEIANVNAPVASIEVQAQAYDALLDAAGLFERAPLVARELNISSETIESWRQEAARLRGRVIDQFWNEKDQRFIQAIDRDPESGQPRSLDVPTSNELELLDSRLLHDVPPEQQQKYVGSLVRQAMSDEFLTDAGIRCRAKSARDLVSFDDYHGSAAVWFVITHKIADGLLSWGLNQAAYELDARVVNAMNTVSDKRNEFVMADPETNEVYYRYMSRQQAAEQGNPKGKIVIATNMPERVQAWSEAAALDIKIKKTAGIYGQVNPDRPDWLEALEKEVLESVKPIEILGSLKELRRKREQSTLAIVDIEAGKAADAAYHALAKEKH